MHNKNYISVGIDVGSAFSFMTILAPDETVILKPFKITHNNKDSLERAVSEIKKEIEKVKKAAQEYDPTEKIKQELDLRKQIEGKSSDELIQESKEEINKLSDEYQGPVSR